MSSHHTILGILQSVSVLCHLVSERPVPYGCGHVPSVPVTSAAQPFADGSVSSPPDSRQTVPEKAWGKCRRSNGSSAAGVAHAAYTGEGCPLRVLGSPWQPAEAESCESTSSGAHPSLRTTALATCQGQRLRANRHSVLGC